jgi:type VI secretion system protein ImpC
VLHHEEFAKTESAWRGLSYLVNNTETDELLKLNVINISKETLRRELKHFTGVSWNQSDFYKAIYSAEFNQSGGQPYGYIVADYSFDHSPQDIEMLREMSKTAAAAHCPLLTSAAPKLLGFKSWRQLPDEPNLRQIFGLPQYIPWRNFRQEQDTRYIYMTLPRFMARLPWGANTTPVDNFAFEEQLTSADDYCWANAAYTLALNINKSFKDYGSCSEICGYDGGGLIKNLPFHTFPTADGQTDFTCPTEVMIDWAREEELAKLGFVPVVYEKNTNRACIIGAQSLQEPEDFRSEDATEANASAQLSARLPYLMVVSRFAHYLKVLSYRKVGSFADRDGLQNYLTNWLKDYITGDPNPSEEEKARKPLADGRIDVQPLEDNPGYYTAHFYLRPHYKFEGLQSTIHLVSKVPARPLAIGS